MITTGLAVQVDGIDCHLEGYVGHRADCSCLHGAKGCTGWATGACRAALLYQHATDERAQQIAAALSDLVEKQSHAVDEGVDRRHAGGLGTLSPRPNRTPIARGEKLAPVTEKPQVGIELLTCGFRVERVTGIEPA